MKKKLLTLILAAALLLSLAACSASGSSTSTVTVSTSVTDENGTTKTDTTTSERGVSVGTDGIKTTHNSDTSSTTTPANSPEEIVAWWYDTYKGGAIGENADGDRFLLAYDDPEDITQATLTILSADGRSIYIREGSVRRDGEGEDEHLVLVDESRDVTIPFDFYKSDKGDFDMYFLADGDTAVMNVVDQDTILGEMRSVLETTTAVQGVNSASAKKSGGEKASAAYGSKSGYDAAKVRADWEQAFSVGAEGRNAAGEYFLLAIDDPDDMKYVAFMIMSADLKTLELYLVGDVRPADDGKGFVMVDDHSDMTVPFTIHNTDEGFELGFKDGDVAKMEGVSQKTILDDMLGIIEAAMD